MALRSVCTLLLLSTLFPLTASGQTGATPPNADDLLLVDCKLPAKTKRIGGKTYMLGAKPARTTALDCRIRGGEYTVYDRGNYATSLKVWLAEAEKGNVEAEYYVGKIYEGGLGTEPDYKSAASWYGLVWEGRRRRPQRVAVQPGHFLREGPGGDGRQHEGPQPLPQRLRALR